MRSVLSSLRILPLLWFLATLMQAQSVEPWLPVAPEDLQDRRAPSNSQASAIQLYYSYLQDDNNKFVSVYRRIKILTDEGRKYADVEIRLKPGESLKELKARTIHPDGGIVDFQDKPFEKVIVKARGVKYAARTFTLPGVSTGSIIEYSYIVNLRLHHVDLISQWPLQSELYTVKERFRYRPTTAYVNIPSEWSTFFRTSRSFCSYAKQAGSALPTKDKDGNLEINLQDVAAFESEEFMPPASDYQPSITCYYGGHELISPAAFWDLWQKRITESIEKWIGKPSAVSSAAGEAIGGETDPEKKLRKLYARVQQIRNLSYEIERTDKEEQRAKLKPNTEAKDVLQHGYGTHWEIDALFVALARAAGFQASMLSVSDRHERTFSSSILWLGQLDGVAVVVTVNDKEAFLDPGTRYCPFGMLPWKYSSATALLFKPGGGFIQTPQPFQTTMSRTITVSLKADGSAEGEIELELTGQEALQHRLDAYATDEAGRRKSLEDEVQSWLPSGALVEALASQGWESEDEPLQARFKISIPILASRGGQRLVVPAFFLPTALKTMFAASSRQYPIEFPFAFTETDQVSIRLPSGYALEKGPDHREAGLSYAGYNLSSSEHEGQLVTKRVLRFDGLSFPPENYDQLRNFFNVVHHGDADQAVLLLQQTSGKAAP